MFLKEFFADQLFEKGNGKIDAVTIPVASKFVGIKFENRVSRVTVVDQEEAKQFVR